SGNTLNLRSFGRGDGRSRGEESSEVGNFIHPFFGVHSPHVLTASLAGDQQRFFVSRGMKYAHLNVCTLALRAPGHRLGARRWQQFIAKLDQQFMEELGPVSISLCSIAWAGLPRQKLPYALCHVWGARWLGCGLGFVLYDIFC